MEKALCIIYPHFPLFSLSSINYFLKDYLTLFIESNIFFFGIFTDYCSLLLYTSLKHLKFHCLLTVFNFAFDESSTMLGSIA